MERIFQSLHVISVFSFLFTNWTHACMVYGFCPQTFVMSINGTSLKCELSRVSYNNMNCIFSEINCITESIVLQQYNYQVCGANISYAKARVVTQIFVPSKSNYLCARTWSIKLCTGAVMLQESTSLCSTRPHSFRL